ncbi:hypothetical protein [Streptomyces clavuligerus]|uniref:hypothetical protein n=1 Tax=Streptomyces clavuligerus TaxID=1901 RepID=UPI00020D93BF|nr:hypothetical protein [Streptomyces clavuligerus]MBY6307381.1 hypothetical protein [Streptomyces clavuligerus]QCS10056.1 hypothetical protein CRV15_31245 [Streptomyces clavuligerus]QPJ97900.1 hypothetical protein GE265_33205 [Streptomyces clavuligerus]WDN56762.1 hypothetical protein LL058_33670 [Streptomyces clavuligerus]
MLDPVVLVVVVVGARLLYALTELWTRPARERAWAHAMATVLRAAGPGGTVEATRREGGGVTARTASAAERDRLAAAGREARS